MLHRFASNALANLIAGVSGTVFQLGLTAIASRRFDRDTFTVWSLALSMAALVPLFAVNLSTVVTRELVELPSARAGIAMRASHEISWALGAVALVVIAAFGLGLHQVSRPLAGVSSIFFFSLVLVLTIGQLWQILCQPGFGWFYAHEKNWQVARTFASARIGALASLLLIGLAASGDPLTAALCIAGGAWLGIAAAGRTVSNRAAVDTDVAAVREQRLRMRHLLKGFAIWSVGSAAIQNGLPALLSVIEPRHYNGFFLAYTLNLVVLGIVGNVASALLAPLSRKRLAGDVKGLERWLAWAPVATGLVLVVSLAVLWWELDNLLTYWSPGIASIDEVRRYIHWLALQTIARSLTLIYSVLMSSAGTPWQLSRPILLELSLTLFVALPLGWWGGDIAFLAALAGAGLITALYMVRTTLDICAQQSRGRLFGLFALTQLLALGTWEWISG